MVGVAPNVFAVLASAWAYLPQLLALWGVAVAPNALTVAVAFIVVGVRSHAIGILGHETYHATLYSGRKLNELTGAWLFSYPVFGRFFLLRQEHWDHHRHFGTPNDPDFRKWTNGAVSRDEHLRSMRDSLFGINPIRSLLRVLGAMIRSRGPTVVAVAPGSRKAPLRSETLQLAATQLTILGLFALTLGWYWYWILWVLPVFTVGACVAHLRVFLEHQGGTLKVFPNASALDRFVFGCFAFYVHGYHHLHPQIPWYRVPAEFKAASDEDKSKLTESGSYFADLYGFLVKRES